MELFTGLHLLAALKVKGLGSVHKKKIDRESQCVERMELINRWSEARRELQLK